MKLGALNTCPGTLAEGYDGYSPVCLRKVFNNKKVSHILPYEPPQKSEEVEDLFMENRKRISISGVQEKLSLLLEKNNLRLTKQGERGTYLLKPIPRDLKKVDQIPANEHLTMQIAEQVYKIKTAPNAMIFFKNGTPAYITRRFDVKPDGSRWGKEDFASLAGKTKDTAGSNFKYEFSYEELALLIRQYIPAWRFEMERYFSLVLFNYLMSNGDAHLKNFSALETPKGDYILSPAYDLLNSRLHVADTYFALHKGLFADDFKSAVYRRSNHPHQTDFLEFGKRIGLTHNRVEKLMMPFLERQPLVETLTHHSFLNQASKRAYLLMYNTRWNNLLG